MRRRVTWLAAYAVGMAYVESAVVVYLRTIYYPHGFAFPLALIEPRMAAIEIGREAATLLMLLAVAALAGRDRWERFLAFCLSFGVWDLFYYVWLWVFLRWPPSLFTWDVLFLIPVPWIGPILAPVIVALGLVVGSLLLLRLKAQGAEPALSAWAWVLAVAGGVLVVGAFTVDFQSVLEQQLPPPFRWWLFGLGVGLAAVSLALGIRVARPSAGACGGARTMTG